MARWWPVTVTRWRQQSAAELFNAAPTLEPDSSYHIQLTFREGEPRKAPSIIFSDNARVYTLHYSHFNTPLFNNIQQCMFDLFVGWLQVSPCIYCCIFSVFLFECGFWDLCNITKNQACFSTPFQKSFFGWWFSTFCYGIVTSYKSQHFRYKSFIFSTCLYYKSILAVYVNVLNKQQKVNRKAQSQTTALCFPS